jgi:hypothetical protein
MLQVFTLPSHIHQELHPASLLCLQELHGLVLEAACSSPAANNSSAQQQQQQQQAGQGAYVTVTAGCTLPAGLYLTSSSSSLKALTDRPISCQQLLIDDGPAAAASQHSLSPSQKKNSKPAAAAAAAGTLANSSFILSSLGGMQHVYEMVVCPAEEDPLRHLKLQLLASAGLGLSHSIVTPLQVPATDASVSDDQQKEQQQDWQQQHLTNVLAEMAVALCDDDQLLQPAVVQRVLQERQQMLAAAAGGTAAGVSATAGMLVEEGVAAAASAAATTACGLNQHAGVSGSEGAAAAAALDGAWENLKAQLLKRYGKACRKQLAQAFKADLQAVQAAAGELQVIMQASAAAAAAAKQDAAVDEELQQAGQPGSCSSGCVCSCHGQSVDGGSSGGKAGVAVDKAAAAAGVRMYLEGQATVLQVWMAQLQGLRSSSSSRQQTGGWQPGAKAAAGSKQGGGRGATDKKRAKKQRQA